MKYNREKEMKKDFDVRGFLYKDVLEECSNYKAGLPPNGRHRKKVLNYFVGGVYGSPKKKKV